MKNPNAEHISKLQAQAINQIGESLRGHTQVTHIDFPHHRNAGDSLIRLGERRALRDIHVDVRYVADMRTYRPNELDVSLDPGAPILIDGGGNFGNLWPIGQLGLST